MLLTFVASFYLAFLFVFLGKLFRTCLKHSTHSAWGYESHMTYDSNVSLSIKQTFHHRVMVLFSLNFCMIIFHTRFSLFFFLFLLFSPEIVPHRFPGSLKLSNNTNSFPNFALHSKILQSIALSESFTNWPPLNIFLTSVIFEIVLSEKQ